MSRFIIFIKKKIGVGCWNESRPACWTQWTDCDGESEQEMRNKQKIRDYLRGFTVHGDDRNDWPVNIKYESAITYIGWGENRVHVYFSVPFHNGSFVQIRATFLSWYTDINNSNPKKMSDIYKLVVVGHLCFVWNALRYYKEVSFGRDR